MENSLDTESVADRETVSIQSTISESTKSIQAVTESIQENIEEIVRVASTPKDLGAETTRDLCRASTASRLDSDHVKIAQPAEKNPVEGLSNADLVKTVNELQKSTRYLELENGVFINFLRKSDPKIVQGIENVIAQYTQAKERASFTSRKTLSRRSTRMDSGTLWASSHSGSFTTTNISVAVEKEGPRINITQKTDLILREMDEIKASLAVITKKYSMLKHKLKAEIEEMTIRESEIRETMEMFENVFITGTVEKYTQHKNPAEKFARPKFSANKSTEVLEAYGVIHEFMEEWFKTTRLTVDKIRLRTSSLKVQYQKISNQLSQKKLLGEHLQEVDFEQLQIENKNLVTKIDQRNLLLIELKRMNGKANLLLSQNKKLLLKKLNQMQEIRAEIALREEGILKFDEESDKVATELDDTKSEYDKIKMKTETYEVPNVLDYVKKKAELGLLKKNLKIWARRKQIKDMALMACIRQMKSTTGEKTVDPVWLNYAKKGSVASTFEFSFDRRRGKMSFTSNLKRGPR